MKRLLAGMIVVGTFLLVPASPAVAHPLGNFTVNQYSELRVQPDRILLGLVVDEAEIPTFQAKDDLDTSGDGRIDVAEREAFASRTCEELRGRVQLAVDGRAQQLRLDAGSVELPPGQAGLPTLRLTCSLTAVTGESGREREVLYRSSNLEDRVGWREITALGDGVTLVSSTVPADSVSARLTNYPGDLLQSPLDQRMATLRVRPGGPGAGGSGPAAAPTVLPRGVDRATRAFTSLVSRQHLSLGFGLFATLVAVVLGAIHAVAPGHGKTVMAAFVVGQRGSLRQVGLICLTVAATHTVGVLALGIVLSTSTAIAPDRLYPWLGFASGLLVAAIGAGLLRGALRRRLAGAGTGAGAGAGADAEGNEHEGAHGHHHSHGGGHGHSHDHDVSRWTGSRTGLMAVGFAGGLVPSPSALVVLLGAIALGRSWFGLVLVLAYGVGMAAMLGAAGLLLVRVRHLFDTRARRARAMALAGALPVVTASLIVIVGLVLAARGAAAL